MRSKDEASHWEMCLKGQEMSKVSSTLKVLYFFIDILFSLIDLQTSNEHIITFGVNIFDCYFVRHLMMDKSIKCHSHNAQICCSFYLSSI